MYNSIGCFIYVYVYVTCKYMEVYDDSGDEDDDDDDDDDVLCFMFYV